MFKFKQKKYLTVNELARRIEVSPHTVRGWARRGAIQAVKHPISRFNLIELEEAERIVRAYDELSV